MARRKKLSKKQIRNGLFIGAYLVLVAIIAVLMIALKLERAETSESIKNYEAVKSVTGVGDYGSAHVHADFSVFVHGKEVDLTGDAFLDGHPLTHLHSGKNNDQVIHVHATGITYGMFFSTIGINVGECFELAQTSFCDENGNTLSYYVNGKIVSDLSHKVIEDLDKVLITYGNSPNSIKEQLNAVGDNACIQSGVCQN
jgi:hypothetical protein